MTTHLKHRPGALYAILFGSASLATVFCAAIGCVIAASSLELAIAREALEPHGNFTELPRELKLAKTLVRASTSLTHIASLIDSDDSNKIDSYVSTSLMHLAFFDAAYEGQAIRRTEAQIAALGLLSRGEAVSALAISTTKDLDKIEALEAEMVRLKSGGGYAAKSSIQQYDRYTLIARDFGELMSLPPLDMTKDGKFPFYKKGVLKGLPALLGLPDDIPDLLSLRTALEKLKATVKTQGNDAAATFAQKIASLREDGETLIREAQSAQDDASNIQQKIEETARELRFRRTHAKSNLRAIFLSIVGQNPLDTEHSHLALTKFVPVKEFIFKRLSPSRAI